MCATLKLRSDTSEHRLKMRRILVEDRIVILCESHAAHVREYAPSTLTELRALFRERRGKRSLIARRAPVDRRVFPARPEGRRASNGRRAGDA